jgi:hypothetical protein
VKYSLLKDEVLPKFQAKVIVDTKNKFKMHKYNMLAMNGIKPPRPRRRQSPEK